MNMEIENIPCYRIAYIRNIGPYGQDNVQVMEKLKKWAEYNGLLNDQSIILGIAYDNPKIVRAEDCRYDIGLVISSDYSINNDSINEGRITGGKYAVFKITHTSEAIEKAWNEIFPRLIKLGFQFDDTRTILERYTGAMVKNHCCEICVPICIE